MEEIDIKDMFKYFVNKYKFIFKFVFVFFIISLLVNVLKFRIYYEADSKVAFLNSNQTEITNNKTLMSSYFALAHSDELINNVRESLDLGYSNSKISKSISLVNDSTTNVVTISIKGLSKDKSSDIANTVADEFINSLKINYPSVKVNVLDYSNDSYLTSNIGIFKNVIMVSIVGFILSLGVLFLIYYFDDTIRGKNQLELLKLSILGYVKNNPKSDCFRTIRTNLDIPNLKSKTILVTSPNNKEGKTYISCNLAQAIANIDKNVLLIDCNINDSMLDKIYNVNNELGLIDVKDKDIMSAIAKKDNLSILPFGINNYEVKEIFSNKFETLLNKLKSKYDYIILDGPSLNDVTDTLILSKLVDTTVLVSKYNKTKLKDLELSKSLLNNVNSNIIGVILNDINEEDILNKIKKYFNNLINKIKVKLEDSKEKHNDKKELKKDFKENKKINKQIKKNNKKLNKNKSKETINMNDVNKLIENDIKVNKEVVKIKNK